MQNIYIQSKVRSFAEGITAVASEVNMQLIAP